MCWNKFLAYSDMIKPVYLYTVFVMTVSVYRMSINSFPDYKHLLQENYMEYKHIFLPLLKLVSKFFFVMCLLLSYKKMLVFHVVFL
jgi:hypothetical protein